MLNIFIHLKMQIKTILRHHFIPTRLAKKKKKIKEINNPGGGNDRQELDLTHC